MGEHLIDFKIIKGLINKRHKVNISDNVCFECYKLLTLIHKCVEYITLSISIIWTNKSGELILVSKLKPRFYGITVSR